MIEDCLNDCLKAQEAIIRTIDRNRYGDFEIEHAEEFVNVIREIKAKEGQSEIALDLYKKSLVNHYEILKSLTKTVTPMESAFLEWMQTPVVVEILYDLDPGFSEAAKILTKTIDESDDLISTEAMRMANGFYGVTSAMDFAPIPGSTFSLLYRITERSEIDGDYAKAFLSSKSWGLNTSYIFGNEFLRVFKETKNFEKAVRAEKEALKRMIVEPVRFQIDFMKKYVRSFDPAEYMRIYREKMFDLVKKSINEVHLANIVMLPTHVGDVGHHIGWQYYHICRDEANMELLRVHLAMLKRNLRRALDSIENPLDISYYATGISSLLIYRILWDEGFTAEMLTRLFTERFYNYVMLRQFERNVVNELHVNDLLDFAFRGQKLAEKGWRVGNLEVDFEDYEKSLLMKGELYAFPFCAVTTKFATLMKFADMPCLLAPEPISILSIVNAVALNPEKPFAPSIFCKNCATAHVQPFKCIHCVAKV